MQDPLGLCGARKFLGVWESTRRASRRCGSSRFRAIGPGHSRMRRPRPLLPSGGQMAAIAASCSASSSPSADPALARACSVLLMPVSPAAASQSRRLPTCSALSHPSTVEPRSGPGPTSQPRDAKRRQPHAPRKSRDRGRYVVGFYNRRRRYSALGYQSPVAFHDNQGEGGSMSTAGSAIPRGLRRAPRRRPACQRLGARPHWPALA